MCGTVVKEDTLLCLRKEQILVDGQEETTLACYWVTDGIDRCRIGVLKHHMIKYAWRFDGALMQVTREKCTTTIMVAHLGPSCRP